MLIRNWLTHLTTRRTPHLRRDRRRPQNRLLTQPSLAQSPESLEDRTLLSTLSADRVQSGAIVFEEETPRYVNEQNRFFGYEDVPFDTDDNLLRAYAWFDISGIPDSAAVASAQVDIGWSLNLNPRPNTTTTAKRIDVLNGQLADWDRLSNQQQFSLLGGRGLLENGTSHTTSLSDVELLNSDYAVYLFSDRDSIGFSWNMSPANVGGTSSDDSLRYFGTISSQIDVRYTDKPIVTDPAQGAAFESGDSVRLAWSASLEDPLVYRVERSRDPSFMTGVMRSTGIRTNTLDITADGSSGIIYWRVRAEDPGRGPGQNNFDNYSDWSDTAAFRIESPARPSNLQATAVSSSQIDLTWDDNSNQEDGFRIYRGRSPSSLQLIKTVNANVESYRNNGLLPDSTYYYVVSAFNSGDENLSSIASAKTDPPPPDTTRPTATLTAANITSGGGSTHIFTVRYSDNVAVDASDIDSSDVSVTGPGGSLTVTKISQTPTFDTTPITATYRISAPGGSWDSADNGTYTVSMNSSQVSDTTNNNFVLSGSLGSFQVSVPTLDTTRPTATLTAANITSGGGSTHIFTVRYSDNVAVDASDINSSDVSVTGPGGSLTVTKISQTPTFDTTPITATYRISAPGGSWDSADNGTYNVSMNSSQVSDTSGNFVLSESLDAFEVNIPGTLPFFDSFSSTGFDSTKWIVVDDATIDSAGINEPSGDLSARFNGHPDGGDRLESVRLDLSTETNVGLEYYFQQTGGGERADNGDDLIVEYRNAAGTWIEIDRQLGSGPDMTTFEKRTLSLPVAALHSQFQLRLRSIGSTSATSVFDDWFVDDVKLSVVDTTRPTATLTALNITSSGGSTHSFTVRYSDNVAVEGSDIDSSDVSVTGPDGSLTVTKTSQTSTSDTTPITATYRISAPGGSWDASDNGTYTVSMNASQVSDTSDNFVSNGNIGTFTIDIDAPAQDFGDAPAPYRTTLAENGARHSATGPRLGSNRDIESDGVHSTNADHDDLNGGSDDEDGVTFGTIRVGQLDASVTVNVQNAPSGAKLDAWIDFNGDGSWGGPGEQIFDKVGLSPGDSVLMFDVPSYAHAGSTYARFRLSTAGDLGTGGEAADGEVEDYQVTIISPAAAPGGFGGQHTISTAAEGATSVFAADVDGDGNMDVLSASTEDGKIVWYENDGNENFVAHIISTAADGAVSVIAADVDGDGDMDVLSASTSAVTGSSSDDKIAWYENDGNQNFTAHVISTAADGAFSVFAADVDGDGDIDVLSASVDADKIAWYENDGNQNFAAHIISTAADGAVSVFAADVDGDGDLDVLSASIYDGKIVWYENDGAENFTTHVITAAVDAAISVFAADVDGDGDTDVLGAFRDGEDGKIVWYENDGDENFTAHVITADADWLRSVVAADVDGDGDIDVLSASSSSRTDSSSDNKIDWYENDGNENFTAHVISIAADGAFSVFAADVDGDGDLDVLSASVLDDKIAWYENLNLSLIVTSPNGGESWQEGSTQTITWDSTGNPGSNVKFELYKGGQLNRTISSSTSNDGSYVWTIPSSQATGSDYTVKITSTSNSSYTDTSNANFSITASAEAAVISIGYSTVSGTVTRMNVVSGTRTSIGFSGIPRLNSLARDIHGTFWSVGGNAKVSGVCNPGGVDYLVTIDPNTGAGTERKALPSDLAGCTDIRALAFSPANSLFAINDGGNSANGDVLYVIDTLSGNVTAIGGTGRFGLQALSFSSSGTLYGYDLGGLGLVTIDTSTGGVTDIDPVVNGTLDVQTIAFSPDGRLYGGGERSLYQINLDTGEGELIHTTGVGRGMAFLGDLPPVTLTIAATDATKPEGNTGATPSTVFKFTVTRSGDTSGSTTVNWAVTGSGSNPADGADFVGGTFPSGTVTFVDGQTTAETEPIDVPVNGDMDVEPDETFTVTLSGASDGAIITTATAAGTIQNDDGISPPSNVQASDGTHPDKIVVTWNTAPGAHSYVVIRNTTDDATTATFVGSTTALFVENDDNITPDTTYYYWVHSRIFENGSAVLGPVSQSDSGFADTTAPTVDIVDVTPDPRNTNAGTVTINFNEDVTGVDITDFSLTRDDEPVPGFSDLSVMPSAGPAAQFTIDVSGVSGSEGLYVLTLKASGSGIQDAAGDLLVDNAMDSWLLGTDPVVSLPDGGGDYEVLRDGGDLVVRRVAGAELFRQAADTVTSLTVSGSSSADIVTVLASTGGVPLLIDGNGGDDMLNAADHPFAVSMTGGDGNDSIFGGAGNDLMTGGDGNDTLDGGSGDDTLGGGLGNDVIDGGDGAFDLLKDGGDADLVLTNSMMTGIGNDTLTGIERAWIVGGPSPNVIDASGFIGTGFTILDGAGGGDTLFGTAGPDILTSSANGSDSMVGNDGDDFVFAGSGRDTILGGAGNDVLFGQGGSGDRLFGGTGNDRLHGGVGHDFIFGEEGNDRLFGVKGNDRLFGGPGRDNLLGGLGNDSLDGGKGNDLLIGGDGDDSLVGGGGRRDRVYESADADFVIADDSLSSALTGSDQVSDIDLFIIDGGNGNNRIDANATTISVSLRGGGGHDSLFGGAGTDTLLGGSGNDLLIGRGSPDDVLSGEDGDDREYQDDVPDGEFEPDFILDNGEDGFSADFKHASGGHGSGYLYGGGGPNNPIIGTGATWSMTGLTPGSIYEIAATWVVHTNRATDAPYRINGADAVRVDQEVVPIDFMHGGTGWRLLGRFTADASGVLEVRLGVDANEYVIADAIFAAEPGLGS
jgi:Ca2+-binding RTX toxin-like protein